MHRTSTLRSKLIIIIIEIQEESNLSQTLNHIKTGISNENEQSNHIFNYIENSVENLDFFQMDINNNIERFDLDYKLNDNELKCYPGQRRPKLKVNKGNLNDIYSEYDFISKPSTTEQNISFNNKNEFINKELSKDNCKSNNFIETKIKLKKSKQNKNKENNRNSGNYILSILLKSIYYLMNNI